VPERLVIDPQNATFEDLAPAARVLLDGGLVAGPTDTFYALMVLVDNEAALDRITRIKGQREEKPFLILVDQIPRLSCYAREIPEKARGLMDRFWPGPLTLLFLAQNGLHPGLVGPARTVGLRLERLPAVRRLVRMVDRGLTGTSANPGGRPPVCRPEEVLDYFGGRIDLLIDGGPTAGGQPSTIIDVSLAPPRLLRAGGLPASELSRACPVLKFKS
jgi:L-threonylcarbamoyladenylate synthase